MPNSEPVIVVSSQSFFKNKPKIGLLLAIILFILLMLILLLNYFRLIQISRFIPALSFLPTNVKRIDDPLLATVGVKPIFLIDVKQAALQQYKNSSLDNKILKIFLDQLIERNILDIEAEKLRINIANTKSKSDYYNQLKEEIISKQIQSREVYVLGFWVASFDYPQKPEYSIQRIDVKKALDEIEAQLRKGGKIQDIAQSIYNKYPSIQSRLSVNGYNFGKIPDKKLLDNPKIYTLNPIEETKAYYDKLLMDTIFSLKKSNEIKQINRGDGSGGAVIELININKADYPTYENWLKTKKYELVKIYQNI